MNKVACITFMLLLVCINTADAGVRITSPTDGSTVSGVVSLACTAAAADTREVLRVDPTRSMTPPAKAALPPCGFNWDSSRVPDGIHTLRIAVYQGCCTWDGFDQVSVVVANGLKPTPTPSASVTINGVYDLPSFGETIPSSILTNPNIDGIAIRTGWNALEPQEGTFDWSGIDAMIAQVAPYHKKVSISVAAGYRTPSWVYAYGPQTFSWLWDRWWGPAMCSTVRIPVPWDPILEQKWSDFVAAFGAKYNSNPAVSHVKLTGGNSDTAEIYLPHSVNESINNGQCVGADNVANWQSAGYTRKKLEHAWEQTMADFNAAFPDKHFALMAGPCLLPPIDDRGSRISGTSCDAQGAVDLLNYGIANYGGGRFVGQHDGLSSASPWSTLVADGAYTNIGFQERSVLGSAFPQAAQNAVNAHASFVEVYEADLTNSSLQSAIAALHSALVGDPVSTPTPRFTPTPASTPKPTPGPTSTPTHVPTPTPTPASTPSPDPVAFGHVFIVVEENLSYAQVIGNASMPYLSSLISNGALATQYYANGHPSLPNYLWLTSGSNDGITTDVCPDTVTQDNVVRHLAAQGISWRAYMENLKAPGSLTCGGDSTGLYAGRHDPFIYYTDVQQNPAQAANIVPFTQLATDIANNSFAKYNFIAPNVCDDGHDSCAPLNNPLAQIDSWLSKNIAPLLNTNMFQPGGDAVLIVTFDEGTNSTNGGGQVAWVAYGPHVKAGYSSTTLYQHQDTLRMMMKGLGATSFPQAAATAKDMSEFFK